MNEVAQLSTPGNSNDHAKLGWRDTPETSPASGHLGLNDRPDRLATDALARRIGLLDRPKFEVILKVQETCNLNCSYCYMYNMGNELHSMVPTSMPIAVCEGAAELVGSQLRAREAATVSIILHGGEPMLMPPKHFRARMETIKNGIASIAGEDAMSRVEFALQTNGTLVTDQWLDCLHDYGIRASVTIDGPKEYHDAVRVDKHGRGSYDAMRVGVEKLQHAARHRYIKNIGGLSVINHELNGAEAFRHIADEIGIHSFDFLLPIYNWDNYKVDDINGVTRFVQEAFTEWADRDDKRIHIRMFDKAVRSLLKRPDGMDLPMFFEKPFEKPFNIGGFFVVVESDGSIMPDESLRATYSDRFCDMNIATDRSFDGILASDVYQSMMQDHYMLAPECKECTLRAACRSGAKIGRLGMRYSTDNQFANKMVYCGTFIELYKLAARFLKAQGVGAERLNLV